jgi:hypothetical protein
LTLRRLESEQQFHMALEGTGRLVDIGMPQKRDFTGSQATQFLGIVRVGEINVAAAGSPKLHR